MDDEELIEEPLFVGLTRPAMILGIPYLAFVVNAMIVSVIFLALNNVFILLIGIPIHGILYLISAADPGKFAAIRLWIITCGLCLNRKYWQASSFSPLSKEKWDN